MISAMYNQLEHLHKMVHQAQEMQDKALGALGVAPVPSSDKVQPAPESSNVLNELVVHMKRICADLDHLHLSQQTLYEVLNGADMPEKRPSPRVEYGPGANAPVSGLDNERFRLRDDVVESPHRTITDDDWRPKHDG